MTPEEQAAAWIEKYGKITACSIADEFIKFRVVPVDYWELVHTKLKPNKFD